MVYKLPIECERHLYGDDHKPSDLEQNCYNISYAFESLIHHVLHIELLTKKKQLTNTKLRSRFVDMSLPDSDSDDDVVRRRGSRRESQLNISNLQVVTILIWLSLPKKGKMNPRREMFNK